MGLTMHNKFGMYIFVVGVIFCQENEEKVISSSFKKAFFFQGFPLYLTDFPSLSLKSTKISVYYHMRWLGCRMVMKLLPIDRSDNTQQVLYVYFCRRSDILSGKWRKGHLIKFQKRFFSRISLIFDWFPFTLTKIDKIFILLPHEMIGVSYGHEITTNR